MLRSLPVVAVALVAACGANPNEVVKPAAPPERGRVVMISIDGLMPETYLDADRLGLKIPALRKMRESGAFARGVESVFPTVTYPSHTTMVTGVPPRMHGITSNRPNDPLGKNYDGWNWYSEDIAVPTLWSSVQAAGGRAAVITWPVTVGADVAMRVPEFWRAGTPDDQKLMRSLSTPGLLDNVAKSYPALWSKLTPPDVQDEAQFAIAKHVIAHEDPSLVLMHVWMTDDAQHAHGPRSAQAKQAIEAVDKLLGDLIAQLEASPDWERTLLVVVSDHGFAAVEQEINLDVLFAQAGLVDTKSARAYSVANGGSAYVFAVDSAAREKALAIVNELGARARVIEADEIAAMGGDPEAAFAVVGAPGFGFGTKRAGAAFVETPGRGTHGYVPTDANMAASFLAYGPRVQPRDLGNIRMIDVAPTVARWLGVPLHNATGTPLDLAAQR
jgi:predicted AlkP superfamily pyrophosphatase or phosphodiesterase